MATRIGGFRRKSRHKLTKKLKNKGKIPLSKYLQDLKLGAKVCLKAEPAVQKGMYLPRFHGKVGILKAKKGSCYEVIIKDLDKEKTLVVHPVHLQALK